MNAPIESRDTSSTGDQHNRIAPLGLPSILSTGASPNRTAAINAGPVPTAATTAATGTAPSSLLQGPPRRHSGTSPLLGHKIAGMSMNVGMSLGTGNGASPIMGLGGRHRPKRHTIATTTALSPQQILTITTAGSGHKTPSRMTGPHKTGLLGMHPPSIVHGTVGSPLLAPQTPPPSARNLSAARSPLALSPDRRHANNYELQRAAVESAYQSERARNKQMEAKEVDATADQLRFILKQERQRMAKQAGDIARLKQAAVQCQVEAEINEEGRINGLMRHMDTIQLEKSKIVVELEREEELLGSTLKKLEEVRREKSQLLKQIEHEKSHHSNLQTELEGIQSTSTEDDAAAAPPVTAKTSTALSAGSSSLLTMGTLTEDLEEDEEEDDGCGEMVDLPDLAGIQS